MMAGVPRIESLISLTLSTSSSGASFSTTILPFSLATKKLPIAVDQRREVVAGVFDAGWTEQGFAVGGLKTGDDSARLDQQYAVIDNEGRHNVIGVLGRMLPLHVSLRHIAAPASLHCQDELVFGNLGVERRTRCVAGR